MSYYSFRKNKMRKLTQLATFIMIFTIGQVVWGQLLIENFHYGTTTGDLTIISGGNWVAHSGSGVPIQYSTTSLEYTGYISSGIGGSTTFDGGPGSREDVNRGFSEQTSGVIYLSFLLKMTVSTTAADGDFFIHLGDRTSSTSFTRHCAKIYTKRVNSNLRFGLANSDSVIISGTDFSLDTVYLFILKYTINDSGNDEVSMWVKTSGVPSSEEDAGDPLIIITDQEGYDIIDAIGIRQGSSSYEGTIDGIRICTNWNAILSVTELNNNPVNFELGQAYPNPFNPDTHFTIKVGESSPILIQVYDIRGSLVNTLVNRHHPVGEYTYLWNGKTAASTPASSGIYFIVMAAGREHKTVQKVVLVR